LLSVPTEAIGTIRQSVHTTLTNLGTSSEQVVSDLILAGRTQLEAGIRAEQEQKRAKGAVQPVAPSELKFGREESRDNDPPAAKPADGAEERTAWAQMIWMQLSLAGVVLLLGPVLVGLAVGYALRRSNLLFRVEVINAPSSGPTNLTVDPALLAALTSPTRYREGDLNRPQPADLPPQMPMPTASVEPEPAEMPVPETGEQFDLGPTYEEEQRALAEALLARERAILEAVLEQNLLLQQAVREENTQEREPWADGQGPDEHADRAWDE
jgi:hypothetical protein